MSSTAGTETKLMYFWLKPGVSRLNGMTLLYAGLTGIPFLAFINFIQPIVLEVILQIPRGSQGSLTANLAVAQEIILLLLVGPFGALSDRIGRRPVLAFGYLAVAVGFFAYPWSTSPLMLTLVRAGYAVGAAAIVASYSALLADYPEDRSRGKLIALLGVLNGLGIGLLGFVGGNLPKWLEAAEFAPASATRISMALIAVICVISAGAALLGLQRGRSGDSHHRQSLGQLLREGLGAARNPRIAVAYASAFAARGDVVVIGTYLSLWVSQAGIATGMTPAEAQGRAGIEFAIVAGASLVTAPLFGILNDRVDRVSGLVVGMLFAGLGYVVFGLQDTPLGAFSLIAAALLGIGQIGSILAGQTLISQEAGTRIAGSVIGVFSFFGAIGTLVGGWIGGQLFELWRPGAPFLLMGGFNFLVFAMALFIRLRDGAQRDAVGDDLLASSAVKGD